MDCVNKSHFDLKFYGEKLKSLNDENTEVELVSNGSSGMLYINPTAEINKVTKYKFKHNCKGLRIGVEKQSIDNSLTF